MKVSILIKRLLALVDKHGDIEVGLDIIHSTGGYSQAPVTDIYFRHDEIIIEADEHEILAS